jgi:hypothetical protein
MDLILKNNAVVRKEKRDAILGFEKHLSEQPGAVFGDNDLMPLTHTFADKIYVREIFIPKGSVLVGKIHKHSHPNFLLQGVVDVVTEYGAERLTAPMSMISSAGTKRAVHAIEDCRWVTVHENPTNTRDLDELEKYIIAENYDEFDKFMMVRRREERYHALFTPNTWSVGDVIERIFKRLDSCFRRNDKRGR